MKMRSSCIQSVRGMRVRSRAAKLCFGRRLFTTNPSTVRTFRTHYAMLALSKLHPTSLTSYNFAPLPGIRLCAGHSSEAGEEPLRHGVDGVDCGDLAQLRPAHGNVEAQEVLHGGKIRSFDSGPQATSSGRFFVRKG